MVVQSNKPACGGPREGGNRAGAVEASLVSRWVREVVQGCTVYAPKDGIFLITAGSSIQAMTCRDVLMPRAQDAQERRRAGTC